MRQAGRSGPGAEGRREHEALTQAGSAALHAWKRRPKHNLTGPAQFNVLELRVVVVVGVIVFVIGPLIMERSPVGRSLELLIRAQIRLRPSTAQIPVEKREKEERGTRTAGGREGGRGELRQDGWGPNREN